MYRWTERTGCRVIEIQPFERGMVYALFAALVLQLGPILPLMTYGGLEEFVFSVGIPLGLGSLFCAVLVGYWWRETSWIEIPTRPGPIRWGDRSGRSGATEGAAVRVEAVQQPVAPSRFRYSLVAVLSTGLRVPILDRWSTRNRSEVEGVVISINKEIEALDWSGPA